MSFFGRVVADAQRRVSEVPPVRAMQAPAAAAAGATVLGAAMDTAFDAPFTMDVDAFGDHLATHAGDSAAPSDRERAHVSTAAADRRSLHDAGAGESSMPAENAAAATDRHAVRISSRAANVDAVPQTHSASVTPRQVNEGGRAATHLDDARSGAVERVSRAQAQASSAPALVDDHGTTPRAHTEHETLARRAAIDLSSVEMDATNPGDRAGRGSRAALPVVEASTPNAAHAAMNEASASVDSLREHADPELGSAPQDIRQALAMVDAQATRLQRMLAFEPSPSVQTQATRSPPSAPARRDAQAQVTRSAPSVRIDHVDIVVTEPPSRPRRGVQERPGNPASRNYLRRL